MKDKLGQRLSPSTEKQEQGLESISALLLHLIMNVIALLLVSSR